MNWLSALNWWQWIVLGAVPPLIVLLYFLKLRRTPLEVPSTFLWTRTIEDLHVNSIWQKLRNSLLLLLQLLMVALLLLSCLRPGCPGEKLVGERFIFLVDQSASMSAIDAGENGKLSRLDEAKRQVKSMIERMEDDDVAMIISFSDTSDTRQSYTQSKSLLKRKLDGIKQTQRSSDMKEALVAAAGLANPGKVNTDRDSFQVADAKPATLFIFSDGGVERVPTFSLGEHLQPEYHPVGGLEPSKNLGITAFSINNLIEADGRVEAFARIQNSDDEEHIVGVTLYVDGEIFDAAADVVVAPHDTTPLRLDLSGAAQNLEKSVPVRLEIDGEDVYALDNAAYTVLNPPRPSNVLIVTELNPYLELACATAEMKKIGEYEFVPVSYLQDQEYKTNAELGIYDLIIYDQCVPEKLPLCSTIFIGAIPPGDEWKADEKTGPSPIIDFDTSHPLLFSLSFNKVTVVESTPLTGPQGSLSLVDSTVGSLIQIGPRGGFQDLVIGFPLLEYDENGDASVNTDWHKDLSFPLFIQNSVSLLSGAASFNESRTNKPGELINIRPRLPYDSIVITDPDNEKSTIKPNKDNSFVFAKANRTGIYKVTEPESGDTDQLFAVNLLDPRESNLNVRDALDIGYEEVEGTRAETKPARQEFWAWLVGLALLVLVIEWYIYNRRVLI